LPDGIHITLKKSAHFAKGRELDSLVRSHIGPHVKRSGLAVQAEEQRATPRVSGHAQRGWVTGEPEMKGDRLLVHVGNNVVYVPRVNRTSVRNAGFIARGYSKGRLKALQILRQGVKDIAPHLVKAGKG
jgi:hypothetical protein